MSSDSNGNADNGSKEQIPPRRRFSEIRPRPIDISIPNFGSRDLQTVAAYPQQIGLRPDQGQHGTIPPLFMPGNTQIFYEGKLLKQYPILDKVYNMVEVENEEVVSMTRLMCNGRKVRYDLKVLQHPERARACGAGARSSADRRPVDPPPVVQLNIYDIDTAEDITMTYDSAFMLYASLENARPIANGRMHPGSIPVLTGVAVSSPAYLEKPSKAGFFIFPDLSVRHEGYYRLRFSLFEGVKHPENADPDNPMPPTQDEGKNTLEVKKHQAMSNRMEVLCKPFQVFSAKRFPGLIKSTELSKTVAEQGCRVRIRREIRQRKRATENKPNSEESFTPEATPYDMRSISRNSFSTRRMSGESYDRPTPSRTMSIASMSQTSPLTPNAPPMLMAPPPPRQEWQPPSASTYSRFPFDPVRHLPPPLPPQHQPRRHFERELPKLNSILEPMVSKRSHSMSGYDEERSIKNGLRPSDPAPAPMNYDQNAPIEADDEPDARNTSEEYMYYQRADGRQGMKQTTAFATQV